MVKCLFNPSPIWSTDDGATNECQCWREQATDRSKVAMEMNGDPDRLPVHEFE